MPPALPFQLGSAGLGALGVPLLLQNMDSGPATTALWLAALAVLFDLTVTSLLVAWWLRRTRDFDIKTAVGVLLCGLLLGGLTLPSAGARLLAVSLLEALLLGVVVWAAVQVRWGFRELGGMPDPIATVQQQLTRILPRPLTHGLTQQVLMWWSLKGGPGLLPPRALPLTSHLKAGRHTYIWLYVFMELPINFALHMALHHDGNGSGAWLLTFADTSVVLYLLALARSHERFPSFVLGETLYLRQGVRWQAEIPLQNIEKLTPGCDPKAHKLNLLVAPNLTLHLTSPVVLRGPWGRRRESRCLSLFIDDVAALRALLPVSPSPL